MCVHADGSVVWSEDYAGDEQSEIAAAATYEKQALTALSKLLVHKMPLRPASAAATAELDEMIKVARRNVDASPPWPCSEAAACWQKERFMATLQLATMLDTAAASTHTSGGAADKEEEMRLAWMEGEALALYQQAEAAADALLRESSLSPWSAHGNRAGMVAKEHLSVQLREQARPYARTILTDGGGDPKAPYGQAATTAQEQATQQWLTSPLSERGGWGGECDKHTVAEEADALPSPPMCTIERRSAESLSQEEFESEFVALGRPVIITGGGGGGGGGGGKKKSKGLFDKWRAKSEWQRAEMMTRHANTEVTVARSSDIVSLQAKGEDAWAEKLLTMTLPEYIEKYMPGPDETAPPEPNPMYLFRNVPLPELSSYYEHPSYFSNRSHFHMVDRARDAKALFFLGPRNSGAYTHQHTAAWNAIVYGAKRWYLLPPAARHGPDTEMPGGMIEWLRTTKPSLPVVALECTQYAGELLYVPASWWHGVLNLCDTVGVAIEVGVAIPEK